MLRLLRWIGFNLSYLVGGNLLQALRQGRINLIDYLRRRLLLALKCTQPL